MRGRPTDSGPQARKVKEGPQSIFRRWMQLSLTGRMFLLVVIAVLPALVIQAVNEYALRTAREDEIRQRSARVARDDDIARLQRDGFDRTLLEFDAAFQPRPDVNEHVVQHAVRFRKRRIDRQRARRRVVEQQQDLRKQSMSGGEIDDAAAAEEAADAPRHLPRFVQLLARQAARAAHRAGETIEERVARKPTQVVFCEAALRRVRERQGITRNIAPANHATKRPAAASLVIAGATRRSSMTR